MTTIANLNERQHWHRWAPAFGSGALARPVDLRGLHGSAARLSIKRVFVAGLGAVGGKVFENLARLGVGELFGVDPDDYSVDSLFTQPCEFGDAGRSKAEVQGKRAHAIHPEIAIHTARRWAQDVPLRTLRDCDVWICAGDNRELAVWLGVAAAGLGKTLIHGAVSADDSWTACVRVFGLQDAAQSCPGCGLSAAEWAELRHREGCGTLASDPNDGSSTRTPPHVCGSAAELVVAEAVKLLLDFEPGPCTGEEVAYCQKSHRTWRTTLPRNPHCRCPHDRWTLHDVPDDPERLTLRSLQLEAGIAVTESVRVRGELPWVSTVACPRCDRRQSVRRFGHAGDVVGTCPCGAALAASPMGLRSVIPLDDLAACRDVPLSLLGVLPGTAVGFSTGERWTYCFVGRPTETGGSQ